MDDCESYLGRLADQECILRRVECGVSGLKLLERGVAEVDFHGASVNEPLYEAGLDGCGGEVEGHLFGHLLWDLGRHVGYKLSLIVAACRERCVGLGTSLVLVFGTIVAEDAADVVGI